MAAAARLEVSGKGLRLLLRALQAEARRLEMEIAATRERIKTFEERHGISSSEFMDKYLRGELGDNEEYMEWYGELVFLERAQRELEELKRLAAKASQEVPREGQ